MTAYLRAGVRLLWVFYPDTCTVLVYRASGQVTHLSVAADVRHELDYQVWEDIRFPDGKIYIPGVIAHKATTIEPAELVAHRIVRYANVMGRENVIAGTDCGYGNRVYPDIAWAKMRAMAAGAALATRQLWPHSS